MSRRAAVSSDDSLELLLDTICNTFAAVIFISMLAALLAQNSAPPEASDEEISSSVTQVLQTEREIIDAQNQKATLERLLSQQSKLLGQFSSDESRSLAIQIQQNMEDHLQSQSMKTSMAQSMTDSEKQSLELEQQMQQLQKELKEQQRTQKNAENNLRNLETSAGHVAEVRRVHETTKYPFVFALDNGRLYAVHETTVPNPTMYDLGFNRIHCDVIEEPTKTTIRPRKSAGILLRNSLSAKDDAKALLATMSKNFIVKLFVAKDSFPEFLSVKEALNDLNLEYALEPMPQEDVELFLSDKVQDRTFVQ